MIRKLRLKNILLTEIAHRKTVLIQLIYIHDMNNRKFHSLIVFQLFFYKIRLSNETFVSIFSLNLES